MSRENVELVRQIFDAAGRRDAATVFALYDPEVEWDASRSPLPRLVGGSTLRGHKGLQAFFRERDEAFQNILDECEELIDFGEAVISVVTTRGRGRTSGIEAEQRMAAVWTIRDGRAVRVVWFPSRQEALEAVGWRE
jgi:ketosteroid isomerase-like protein